MIVKITDAEFETCDSIEALLVAKGVDVTQPYQWSRIPIFNETLIEQPPPPFKRYR